MKLMWSGALREANVARAGRIALALPGLADAWQKMRGSVASTWCSCCSKREGVAVVRSLGPARRKDGAGDRGQKHDEPRRDAQHHEQKKRRRRHRKDRQ